ncbi:hypothetical protein FRX31_034772 [Thalictrum thalictroides]|uniref:Uncharacterized protein n=1 Tax=Thalictrum thalictroides TaxID=46969 RepID=A0A7J6UT59_THATH|nr:hypothetical protein FRX31_034772 [Thalictrum thalictroides]
MSKEYNRRVNNEESQQVVFEASQPDSDCSVYTPTNNNQQWQPAGTSKGAQVFPKILKRLPEIVNSEMRDNSETSGSVDCPPGFEKKTDKGPVVNFGDLINQECCNLRSTDEVDEWVSGVIGSISKNLGLSSTNGDQAIKKFFLELGYAKLREKKNGEGNDDDRDISNYERCNEELTGTKLAYG